MNGCQSYSHSFWVKQETSTTKIFVWNRACIHSLQRVFSEELVVITFKHQFVCFCSNFLATILEIAVKRHRLYMHCVSFIWFDVPETTIQHTRLERKKYIHLSQRLTRGLKKESHKTAKHRTKTTNLIITRIFLTLFTICCSLKKIYILSVRREFFLIVRFMNGHRPSFYSDIVLQRTALFMVYVSSENKICPNLMQFKADWSDVIPVIFSQEAFKGRLQSLEFGQRSLHSWVTWDTRVQFHEVRRACVVQWNCNRRSEKSQKRFANYLRKSKTSSLCLTNVTLPFKWKLLLIFTGHVIKTKNRNHAINKVNNLGYDGWLI